MRDSPINGDAVFGTPPTLNIPFRVLPRSVPRRCSQSVATIEHSRFDWPAHSSASRHSSAWYLRAITHSRLGPMTELISASVGRISGSIVLTASADSAPASSSSSSSRALAASALASSHHSRRHHSLSLSLSRWRYGSLSLDAMIVILLIACFCCCLCGLADATTIVANAPLTVSAQASQTWRYFTFDNAVPPPPPQQARVQMARR